MTYKQVDRDGGNVDFSTVTDQSSEEVPVSAPIGLAEQENNTTLLLELAGGWTPLESLYGKLDGLYENFGNGAVAAWPDQFATDITVAAPTGFQFAITGVQIFDLGSGRAPSEAEGTFPDIADPFHTALGTTTQNNKLGTYVPIYTSAAGASYSSATISRDLVAPTVGPVQMPFSDATLQGGSFFLFYGAVDTGAATYVGGGRFHILQGVSGVAKKSNSILLLEESPFRILTLKGQPVAFSVNWTTGVLTETSATGIFGPSQYTHQVGDEIYLSENTDDVGTFTAGSYKIRSAPTSTTLQLEEYAYEPTNSGTHTVTCEGINRPEAYIGTAGDLSARTFTYTNATATLSDTGAFAGWTQGGGSAGTQELCYITGGTNATPGWYTVATRPDDDTITLDHQPGTGDETDFTISRITRTRLLHNVGGRQSDTGPIGPSDVLQLIFGGGTTDQSFAQVFALGTTGVVPLNFAPTTPIRLPHPARPWQVTVNCFDSSGNVVDRNLNLTITIQYVRI